jgi:hypothetical protein
LSSRLPAAAVVLVDREVDCFQWKQFPTERGGDVQSTMSLRTAGAVVNAIYDALEKANVLAKIEKRQSPEKSG